MKLKKQEQGLVKTDLPHPPQTVDVPYVQVAPDLELPMQQILPESELEPIDLT